MKLNFGPPSRNEINNSMWADPPFALVRPARGTLAAGGEEMKTRQRRNCAAKSFSLRFIFVFFPLEFSIFVLDNNHRRKKSTRRDLLRESWQYFFKGFCVRRKSHQTRHIANIVSVGYRARVCENVCEFMRIMFGRWGSANRHAIARILM